MKTQNIFMPNGQHNGNLWIHPPFPFPEPERGHYCLTCDRCKIVYPGFNWRVTSPAMFCDDGRGYICDSCKQVEYKHMDYKEYLKTPHWQRVRGEALVRAGMKCQLCPRKHLLEVHHNTYERLGAERPEDVIAICEGCHETHHGVLKSPRQSEK